MMTQLSCTKSTKDGILFLSIMVNIFIGGMFLGQKYSDVEKSALQIAKVISIVENLSPESRDKVIAIAQKDWPDIKKQISETQKNRENVKKLISQPHYKQEELTKDFATSKATVDKLIDDCQSLSSDVLQVLPPEERQKAVQQFYRAMQK